MPMDDKQFDRLADAELHHLEKVLGDFDPDEVEVDFSSGVLTLTLADGNKIVVNSHRAAGQIWMAAMRQAWHFSPREHDGNWTWHTATDELRATLGRLLAERIGRAITL